MDKFKPMLAEDADLKRLQYPVIVSPKLDGVRATFIQGKLRTRSLKPPQNKMLQNKECRIPLDGELVVGDPRSESCFRDTMKVVSAHNADIKDVKFYVFDYVDTTAQFVERLKIAEEQLIQPWMKLVPHRLVANEKELLNLEDHMLGMGYEGLMLRDPKGGYKYGRSTVNEGLLLKLKRKIVAEAVVIGYEELKSNQNQATTDNLGYTERSSHQANMIPMNTLGALIVKDLKTDVQFNVGTGFTAEDRKYIWDHRMSFMGHKLSYEYVPVGVKDRPRFPVFIGWRLDL